MKVTEIQKYSNPNPFKASIIIDDRWILAMGEDGRYLIPKSDSHSWNAPFQNIAERLYHPDSVADMLNLPYKFDDLDNYSKATICTYVD